MLLPAVREEVEAAQRELEGQPERDDVGRSVLCLRVPEGQVHRLREVLQRAVAERDRSLSRTAK